MLKSLLFTFLLFLSFIGFTEASDKSQLTWAGFSFLGNFDQRDARYPYTSSISLDYEEKGLASPIDEKLNALIENYEGNDFTLSSQMADNNQRLFATIGISFEDVYETRVNNKYKVSYEIGLNFVIFDFEEKKIVSIYPMRFLRNEIFSKKPTRLDHANKIKKLYEGNEFNILSLAVENIRGVNIKENAGNYLGISGIEFVGNSDKFLPDEKNIDSLGSSIIQEFEGYLSINNKIPLVPYLKGESLATSMVLRFSDRTKMSLKLPIRDYEIKIKVRGFGFKKSANYYGYTAKIKIIAQDDLNPSLVDLDLSKNIWVLKKAVGRLDDKFAQWMIYKEALSLLLDDTSKQIELMDENWTKKHSINKDAVEQLKTLKILLDRTK